MKIKKITLEFDSDELEALHYAIEMGVRHYNETSGKGADDWIIIADKIRRKLPIKMRRQNDEKHN